MSSLRSFARLNLLLGLAALLAWPLLQLAGVSTALSLSLYCLNLALIIGNLLLGNFKLFTTEGLPSLARDQREEELARRVRALSRRVLTYVLGGAVIISYLVFFRGERLYLGRLIRVFGVIILAAWPGYVLAQSVILLALTRRGRSGGGPGDPSRPE